MKYNPLVSIALTTSKSEKFIEEQIDSLLNQTYKNIEVCVSHDECGDDTFRILNNYAKNDNRLKWSYNPSEKGYIKNTENAIFMCSGEIIFLCDHDDSWNLDRVEEHVKRYEDPNIMWVYNRLEITDSENKKVIGYLEDIDPNYYRHKNILENTWGTCIGGAQTSYRSELLKNIFPVDSFAPAHDSWIQLCIWPAKPAFINKVLQQYRQHGNNQVGVNKIEKRSKEEILETEKRAIKENMLYLKSLSSNREIQRWKRFFFKVVYYLKTARVFIKN